MRPERGRGQLQPMQGVLVSLLGLTSLHTPPNILWYDPLPPPSPASAREPTSNSPWVAGQSAEGAKRQTDRQRSMRENGEGGHGRERAVGETFGRDIKTCVRQEERHRGMGRKEAEYLGGKREGCRGKEGGRKERQLPKAESDAGKEMEKRKGDRKMGDSHSRQERGWGRGRGWPILPKAILQQLCPGLEQGKPPCPHPGCSARAFALPLSYSPPQQDLPADTPSWGGWLSLAPWSF